MKGDEEKCRAAGCSAFVAKPVDIDELMRCLTEQLKGMAAPSIEPGPAVSTRESTDTSPTDHTAGENRLPAESSTTTTDGGIQQDTAEFVRLTRDNLNAMHGALQNRQFAALAELAGSLAQRADEAGHSEFRSLAIQVKELAPREAADEIADVICDLAGLSEAIALRSLESDQRPLDVAAEEPKEIEVVKPVPPPAPRNAVRRGAPLVSSLPMDDPDFRQIVAGFIPRLRAQAIAMQAAWEQRDLDELARLSHWLKGAGGTVGFDALTDPAKTLEQLAKQDQVDEIDGVLAELLDMIDSAAMPSAECNGMGLKL
jgi:HPt (histidine-containing phosphotransfer) domain-containing protein